MVANLGMSTQLHPTMRIPPMSLSNLLILKANELAHRYNIPLDVAIDIILTGASVANDYVSDMYSEKAICAKADKNKATNL